MSFQLFQILCSNFTFNNFIITKITNENLSLIVHNFHCIDCVVTAIGAEDCHI